jgi:hypothetical protein
VLRSPRGFVPPVILSDPGLLSCPLFTIVKREANEGITQMKKPSVIQFTAGLTITMSVGANVWYGIDMMHRGGFQLIVVGVWMPVILALLERVLHASNAGRFFKFMLGLVAFCAMAYSMSHLAHLATPIEANRWEHVSAWLFAITVDVAMVLAGWALMKRIEPTVTEKVVYVEVPAAPAPEVVRVEAMEEETETVTETRQVTRTRRSALTAEQRGQILELGIAGHKPIEIMRKLALEGHPNKITRTEEWTKVLELRG